MTLDEIKDLRIKYKADQGPGDALEFCNMIEKINPKTIVEIGVQRGGSLRIWCNSLGPDGLAIGIDREFVDISWDTDSVPFKVHKVQGCSHEEATINKVKEILGGRKIDVLFIDGDHSEEGQQKDWADYSPLVRDGGIVGIHDIALDQGTIRWWKRFPYNQHAIVVDGQGIGVVVMGKYE